MADYDLLQRTKETVVIVNVERGETVDEDSVLRILQERPETRYATDVFWEKEGREVFDATLWSLQISQGLFTLQERAAARKPSNGSGEGRRESDDLSQERRGCQQSRRGGVHRLGAVG